MRLENLKKKLMEKLISMTDFVLEQMKNTETLKDNFVKTAAYAKFLKQTLELWMFVPCDEDGNVIKEPTARYKSNEARWGTSIETDEWKEYQQAKERCLFECFEFTESQKFSTVNKIKNSVHWYTKDRLYLTTKKEDGYHSYFQLFTVEDLIQCEIQLTTTAQKQLSL